MSDEIDFEALSKDLFERSEQLPDPREEILKAGHYATYGDEADNAIAYIEYPDRVRVTIPSDYLPTPEEIQNRQFNRVINTEQLAQPCYLSDKKKT